MIFQLFLNPLRIFTVVIDCAHVSPTSEAIVSDVITLPGFSRIYFLEAFAYPHLEDLNTPISSGCKMCDV